MPMVKIQIADVLESDRAYMEMARRGRIDCYPNGVYMVPEQALEMLKEMRIAYRELGRGGIDYAEKTLRDAFAAAAQRRTSGRPHEASADA
jgi:hypothetical protein